METEEQLAWEAPRRPRIAALAALSGLLTLGSSIYVNAQLGDPPHAALLDSLARLESDSPVGSQTSLLLPHHQYIVDNVSTLVIAGLMTSAGLVLLAPVMLFLARATQGRAATLPPRAPMLAPIGGAVLAVGVIISAIGAGRHYEKMIEARTVDGLQNVEPAGLLLVGQYGSLLGAIILASGIVLVCLHAMRAGLLTRFLGVLGILVGGLVAITSLMGSGISPVQVFWLFALALLLSGRWPGGDPPAWKSGTAVPWPSNAELREARTRAAEPAERPKPEPKSKPDRATGAPSPATSAKKKRKRR